MHGGSGSPECSAHWPRDKLGELGRLLASDQRTTRRCCLLSMTLRKPVLVMTHPNGRHWLMVSALAHRALKNLTLARSTMVGSSSQHGQWKNVSLPAPSGHSRDPCLGFCSRLCFAPSSSTCCSSVACGFRCLCPLAPAGVAVFLTSLATTVQRARGPGECRRASLLGGGNTCLHQCVPP